MVSKVVRGVCACNISPPNVRVRAGSLRSTLPVSAHACICFMFDPRRTCTNTQETERPERAKDRESPYYKPRVIAAEREFISGKVWLCQRGRMHVGTSTGGRYRVQERSGRERETDTGRGLVWFGSFFILQQNVYSFPIYKPNFTATNSLTFFHRACIL